MITRPMLISGLTAAALWPTAAASATLTAEALWQGWQTSARAAGLVLEAGGRSQEGGDLVLTDLTLAARNGERLKLSRLEMTEKPDGSVDLHPGAFSLTLPKAPPGAVPELSHNGLRLTISEPSAGGIRYSYQAEDLTLSYRMALGLEATARMAESKISLSGLRGSFSDQPGALRRFALDLKADRLLSEAFEENKTKGTDKADPPAPLSRSDTAGLALRGELMLPESLRAAPIKDGASFRAALLDGLSFSFDAAQGITLGEGRDDNFPLPYRMSLRGEPSSGRIALSSEALLLSAESGALDFHITTPLGPQPMDVHLGALKFALTLPATARDTPAPYALELGVRDLTISETAWAVFDSGRVLPRDPVQLLISLGGEMRLDLTALGSESVDPQKPFDFAMPQSLDLRQALIELAGATASATGQFRFKEQDRRLLPVGSADLTLSGTDALLSALTTLGVVTPKNAGIARVMLRSYTRPGPGADNQISHIEARPDGKLLVNGMPVK